MKIYKVGGCVRDFLLGLPPKDIDYVVVGSTPEEMLHRGFEKVGAGPLPVTDQHIQVNFVKPIQGAYGSSLIILIAFDDGKAASWRYSGQFDVHKGDEFIVSGQLEKDAYWTPPRIKFVPDRKWLRGGFKTQIAALDAAGNGTAQP